MVFKSYHYILLFCAKYSFLKCTVSAHPLFLIMSGLETKETQLNRYIISMQAIEIYNCLNLQVFYSFFEG